MIHTLVTPKALAAPCSLFLLLLFSGKCPLCVSHDHIPELSETPLRSLPLVETFLQGLGSP